MDIIIISAFNKSRKKQNSEKNTRTGQVKNSQNNGKNSEKHQTKPDGKIEIGKKLRENQKKRQNLGKQIRN